MMNSSTAKRPRKSQRKRSANSASEGTPKARSKRASQRKGKGYDIEGLALSKNDIIEFCDRVLKNWQKDPAKNVRNIPAMIAVRTSVFFSDEQSLQAIWSEIISWVYQLIYENAQAQARKEGQEWAKVFSKIKNAE